MYRLLLPFALLALPACTGGVPKPADDGTETDEPVVDGDEDRDGFTVEQGDCDDNDASVNPAATEICNSIDDNCAEGVDEGVEQTFYQDFDADGFGNPDQPESACEAPTGYVGNGTDCDDAEALAYPGNVEVCDSIDNDCNGAVDDGVTSAFYADADGDTYGDPGASRDACTVPVGYVVDSTDCDDTTNRSFPGNAEVCDELDNNCDGTVDEGVTTTYYADFDSDRYGNVALTQEACSTPTGYTVDSTDCDDSVASVNPGATEYCNTVDDDCDGTIDEPDAADASTWYVDGDSDLYGSTAASTVSCTQPAGYVSDATDCDDARYETNPGAGEYCNGYDDNCNGAVDEDASLDAPTWYLDADNDTFGDITVTDVQCAQPSRYVADNTDCDDTDGASFPGGIEVCDGADNDCNGLIDDAPTDGTTYYADADTDGYGDVDDTMSECAQPAGYVENPWDCDDTDGTEPVVADAVSGTSGGSGTLSSPLDSLQEAIDRSYQCVIAYPGTYVEQVSVDTSIDIWGIEGAGYTFIDANLPLCNSSSPTGCGSTLTVASGSNVTPTIHGFTITGGTGTTTTATSSTTCADSSASHTGNNTCTVTVYEYWGGGIYINGDDPYFYDISVRDNTLAAFEQTTMGPFVQSWLYSYGGGIAVRDSNAVFELTDVTENYADQGGGIYADTSSNFTFDQGYVSENDAADGGAVGLHAATGNFTNAVMHCNVASTDGGALFTETSGDAMFVNTVFYQNTSSTSGSTRGSQAYIGASTTFYLWNSIVEASSTVYALYGVGSGSDDYNNAYNSRGTVYGGSLAAGANTISSGSNFNGANCDNNPNNDDFSLRSASGGINTGNPAVTYNDADGSRNDMGAYGGPGGSW